MSIGKINFETAFSRFIGMKTGKETIEDAYIGRLCSGLPIYFGVRNYTRDIIRKDMCLSRRRVFFIA